MNDEAAQQILDKTIAQILGYKNPLSLDQAFKKFAFDLKLPQQVYDNTTQEETWTALTGATKYITQDNTVKRANIDDWMLPSKPMSGLEDILAAWSETNMAATERTIESTNVAKSDSVYNSESVYHSHDVTFSKNILFCDSVQQSEFLVASSRSQASSFCVRVEGSRDCTNSFNIVWSGKVSNSLFLQNCYDVQDSMFCSHIASKRFCIANRQFEEAEYRRLRDIVVRWILTEG